MSRLCPECKCVDDCRCTPKLYIRRYNGEGKLTSIKEAKLQTVKDATTEAANWARWNEFGASASVYTMNGEKRELIFHVRNHVTGHVAYA